MKEPVCHMLHESLGEGEKVSCAEEVERHRRGVINPSGSAVHQSHVLEKQTWFAGCKPQSVCDQKYSSLKWEQTEKAALRH